MNPQWSFVVCDALEKVYFDLDSPRPWDPAVQLSTTLGETVSFQLAYRPPLDPSWRDPEALTLSVEGPSAHLVTTYRVENVPCELPAFAGHDDGYDRDLPGLYPDVLMPFVDGALWPMYGYWRSVWFDVRTEDSGDAGPHELVLRVCDRTGTELWCESVRVEVIPERLPPLEIVNTHWLHADSIADHYRVPVFSERHWELLDAFIEQAAQMGVTSLLAPVWTPPLDTAVGHYRTPVQLVGVEEIAPGTYSFDFTRLERWLDLCARHGIDGVEVAHLFTQWGAEATPAVYAQRDGESARIFGWDVPATDSRYRQFLEQLIPEVLIVLDEHRQPGSIVFHISDEPHGEEGLASYLEAKAVVADLLEGRRIVDALSDIEFYRTGATPIPVVATSAIEPFLQDRPEELWAYYCVSQDRNVSNRFFALPSARNRVIGHQLFAARIAGFLHWGFNFYYTRNAWALIDPFRDTCAGGAYPGGDAFVVYPGEDGPIPSIRHRVFAQAMADHRAMQAVRDREGFEAVMAVVDPDGTLRFDRFSADPVHYLTARETLNQKLARSASAAARP